jgi:putative membrane protein
MSPQWKSFLQRWIVTTLGVLLAAGIVDGVRADTLVSLLAASLLLGVLNAFLRPILMLFTLPLLLLTLGLFMLVINACLLYFVAHLVKGFYVADFWAAFKGALLISIVSLFSSLLIGKKEMRMETGRHRPPPPSRPNPPADSGSGPIIDV